MPRARIRSAILSLACGMTLSAQNAWIEGRVTSTVTGAPVRRAAVQLAVGGAIRYQTTTDSDGHYRLDRIAPGAYALSAQRNGYLPAYYGVPGSSRPGKSLFINTGEEKLSINLAMNPPAVVTGHIYDENGEPLAIPVRLFREVWDRGVRQLIDSGSVTTDEEGAYRAYDLATGTYFVSTGQTRAPSQSSQGGRDVYPMTYYPSTEDATASTPLRLSAGSEARDIDIRVRKTAAVAIAGTVSSSEPGLRLSFARKDGFPTPRENFIYSQPPHFSLQNVTPGPYILKARSDNAYALMQVDVGTGDIANLDLRLEPLLRVRGKVTWARAPDKIEPVVLGLTPFETDEKTVKAQPAPDGTIEWPGLTPGRYAVDFSPKPAGVFLKSPQSVEIGKNGLEGLEIVISAEGARVNGKVRLSAPGAALGEPVEAAQVLLLKSDGGLAQILAHTTTSTGGEFVMNSIPPGAYRLVAADNLDPSSLGDPRVASGFDGRGVAIELKPHEAASKDLTLNQ